MSRSSLAKKGQFKNFSSMLAAAIAVLGSSSAGWASRIAAPNFPQITGANAAAVVDMGSSDGAKFFDSDNDKNGNGIAFVLGGATGSKGTINAGFAFAKSDGFFPAIAITFAFTIAGPPTPDCPLVTSFSLAGASASGGIASAGAGIFDWDIEIDPFLRTDGDAFARMSFTLTFRSEVIFSANAALDHGVLTTSGAFTDSDFLVEVDGSRTTATLVNINFSVPFTISQSEVGQTLPFRFDQVFEVRAANGGSAQVSGVPEPTSHALLIIGTLIFCLTIKRRTTSDYCELKGDGDRQDKLS